MRILLILLFSMSAMAQKLDQTERFKSQYASPSVFSAEEIEDLRKYKIVFVPGLLSESAIWSDRRGTLDFSIITNDYFSHPLNYFKDQHEVETFRVSASSQSVEETKDKIVEAMDTDKKIIFVTHSLGGLALLDLIAKRPDYTNKIRSVVFLQSPFYGTPVADIYAANPYYIKTLLDPITPYFNTSPETINYLSVKARANYMMFNEARIQNALNRVSAVTLGTTVNRYSSLFSSTAGIMKDGCLKALNRFCMSKPLFDGPYEDSDGMVPISSSRLPGVPHVKLTSIDHGETVISIPFKNIDQNKMVESLIKLSLNPSDS